MFRICFFLGALVLVTIFSCVDGTASVSQNGTDTASINRGKALFASYCGTCHNFNARSIGPNLSGITDSVPVAWMRKFIANPQKMLDENDRRAVKLVREYKAVMPSFEQFSVAQLDDLISFISAQKGPTTSQNKENRISDPIPGSVQLSDLIIRIQPVAQIPISSSNNKPPLARITKLDYIPGASDLFVVDMRGKLYRLNNGKAEVYLDIASTIPQFVHEPGLGAGFGSFAFHPDFLKNGLLYTAHSEKPSRRKSDFHYADSIKVTYQYVLTEWKADDPHARTFSGTNREVFRIDMVTVQHGIQEIAFNPFAKKGDPDYSKLYVCIGDGGAMDDKYTFIAGDPHMPWGTVFRIDPAGHNSLNRKYGIPHDNPFAGNNKGLGEVYAYGFRNPHRISWAANNEAYVANIGEALIESIYKLKPGMHHGWPIREGRFVIDPKKDVTRLMPMTSADSTVPIVYPVASYDHEWGYAGTCGGFVYRGKNIPALTGKYIFGDIPSGKLFFFDLPQHGVAEVKEWRVSLNDTINPLTKICNSKRVDLHFGRDAQNELYILTKANGKIYKLISEE
jgi:glucose/arabinose dehydrogenase/mono/diheme cytochrome c family protein